MKWGVVDDGKRMEKNLRAKDRRAAKKNEERIAKAVSDSLEKKAEVK